jgi:hypothetical protein
MKRLALRLCIGSLLLAAAAAAPGQPSDSDYSTKETRALMHAYARCVVRQQARKAAEALLADVPNDVILKRYRMLVIGSCLTREVHAAARMRFAGDLYRYALADALVNRELRSRPVPDLSAVPPLVHRTVSAPPPVRPEGGSANAQILYRKTQEAYDRAVVFVFLSRYGECIVRADAAGSKALLLTAPDSPEEATRFAALGPALASCLPEGHRITFGKAALRGSIAINYYRLAHAAAAAPPKAARG